MTGAKGLNRITLMLASRSQDCQWFTKLRTRLKHCLDKAFAERGNLKSVFHIPRLTLIFKEIWRTGWRTAYFSFNLDAIGFQRLMFTANWLLDGRLINYITSYHMLLHVTTSYHMLQDVTAYVTVK